jgi:hypothetical protein
LIKMITPGDSFAVADELINVNEFFRRQADGHAQLAHVARGACDFYLVNLNRGGRMAHSESLPRWVLVCVAGVYPCLGGDTRGGWSEANLT